MDEISRPQLALYAVIAVMIGLVGARFLTHGGGTPGTASGATTAAAGARPGGSRPVTVGTSAGEPPVVDVTGAVRRPGVFRLRAGARVQDAVRRAGGAAAHADLSAVNLAAKVSDGAQILVPERGQAAAVSSPAGGTAAPPAQPINLNTATAEQLDALDGVGPSTAQKIVLYRQQHGGFGSVGELDRIPGFGAKKVAAMRLKVRV